MLVAALILLLVVGLSAVLVSNRLNRRKHAELESARAVARQRFVKASAGHSIEEVLAEIGIAPPDLERARSVIGVISATFGLPNSALPADSMLGDVMHVRLSEGSDAAEERVVLQSGYIDPFGYDLVANLLSVIDTRLWMARAETDASFPSDEDALADFIAGMTVARFVQCFTPLAKMLR